MGAEADAAEVALKSKASASLLLAFLLRYAVLLDSLAAKRMECKNVTIDDKCSIGAVFSHGVQV